MSAEYRVCDNNCGKMHEFALALDRGGFDPSLVQQIIQSKDCQLARSMHVAALNCFPWADQFRCIKSIVMRVSVEDSQVGYMKKFWDDYSHQFAALDTEFLDAQLDGKLLNLIPGYRIRVNIFRVLDVCSADDCNKFARSQTKQYFGVSALAMLYKAVKEELPPKHHLIEFAPVDHLWYGRNGNHFVPELTHVKDFHIHSQLRLRQFEGEEFGGASRNDCVVCFKSIPD